jgi:hypothetical protein
LDETAASSLHDIVLDKRIAHFSHFSAFSVKDFRSVMLSAILVVVSTTIQADEKGMLHLPASLLPGASPMASYRVELDAGKLLISKEPNPVNAPLPLWKRSPEEQIQALEEWIASLPPGPGLSDYAVSRDSIYD